jgi:hypothetical protein
MGPLRQRARLLSLRPKPLARGFPHPAPSLAVQPASAPEPRSHRAPSLAPGSSLGCPRRRVPLLRGFGLFGHARPGHQAPGQRMAGRLRRGRLVQPPGVVHEGFCLLVASDPTGVITGFGFVPASTKDQPMAETFFALRQQPNPRLPSVGSPTAPPSLETYYVVDKGFEGEERHQSWLDRYGVRIVCPPKRNSRKPWPKQLRRWVAGLGQIVETV